MKKGSHDEFKNGAKTIAAMAYPPNSTIGIAI